MGRKRSSRESLCVRRLKILADSTRLAIMELLLKGPQHVGEMNAVLGLDQSLFSHHLKALREEGLVEALRDGKAVLYRLAPGVEGSRSRKAINLGCCLLTFERNAQKERKG